MVRNAEDPLPYMIEFISQLQVEAHAQFHAFLLQAQLWVDTWKRQIVLKGHDSGNSGSSSSTTITINRTGGNTTVNESVVINEVQP